MAKEKIGIEFDKEAQEKLDVPLGERELYPNSGQYVAEVLREQNVTFAFGASGGHIWQIVDSISRAGIKTITFGHEQNSVYCGEAYSQITQKPAVCYGTVGPGACNAFSPMQQAFLSGTPIIYLSGGNELEHEGLGCTSQESYSYKFFDHVTKWSTRIHYPHSVKSFITRGFKIAQAAPRGPVNFEIGLGALLTADGFRNHYYGGFFPQHLDYQENWRGEDTPKPLGSAAIPDAIANAAKAIIEAKKPYLVLGNQTVWDQAGPELEEFINLTKVPFNTRRLARAVVSEKHPNCCRAWPPFRGEIDLIIAGGLKVGFFDDFGASWPDTIQICNSEKETYSYVKTKESLLGNVKEVFKQLNEYIKQHELHKQLGPERDEWLKRCQDSYAQTIERRKQRAYKYGPDHPRYKEKDILHFGYISQIIREVNEDLYGGKTRVMIDGFTISDFAMPFLEFTRPASCITSDDHAGVGHGLAMAIGAAFADMENNELLPILALMGDSGMMNAMMDLEVAVRYKLPIVYLVTNNGGWMPGSKFVWKGPNWDLHGEQDRVGNVWRGIKQLGEERPYDVAFEKIAEGLGAYGMLCNRSENFRDDLKKAYAIAEKGQPVVMNCHMDQHLCNKGIGTPMYCMLYAHLPYHELPPRGKALRRNYLKKYFPKLNEEPTMAIPDFWEPLSEEEFGYEPRLEISK